MMPDAVANQAGLPMSCFYCPFRMKATPDDLKCLASGELFEETFADTIERRHKSCPLDVKNRKVSAK